MLPELDNSLTEIIVERQRTKHKLSILVLLFCIYFVVIGFKFVKAVLLR